MNNLAKNFWLAIIVAMLAMPGIAQETGKNSSADSKTAAVKPVVRQNNKVLPKRAAHQVPKTKHSTGEAARLEKNEAGLTEDHNTREENHGRIRTAGRTKTQHSQRTAAKTVRRDQHHATVVNTDSNKVAGTRPKRQASVKTGQLTSEKAARVQTKSASFHQGSAGSRDAKSRSAKDDTAEPPPGDSKTSNQIHLKKHNARMF